eukprot:3976127-Lingulodinium_polyedra.AAC.1
MQLLDCSFGMHSVTPRFLPSHMKVAIKDLSQYISIEENWSYEEAKVVDLKDDLSFLAFRKFKGEQGNSWKPLERGAVA